MTTRWRLSRLYEVAKVINEKPDVDFIYSDKDCLNEQRRA